LRFSLENPLAPQIPKERGEKPSLTKNKIWARRIKN
jgi:hypothetical protein